MTAKSSVYLVKPHPESGIVAKSMLVRAHRRASVEGYLLQAYIIEKATVDDAVRLGAEGVDIVSAFTTAED